MVGWRDKLNSEASVPVALGEAIHALLLARSLRVVLN